MRGIASLGVVKFEILLFAGGGGWLVRSCVLHFP